MHEILVNALSQGGLLFGLTIFLLMTARSSFGVGARFRGYSFKEQAVVKDNPAASIRLAGMLGGSLIAFFGVLHPSGIGWMEDLNLIAEYSMLVVLLLWVSRVVNDKLILPEFDNNNEVVGKKNVAVAVVEFATYLATGLVMWGALEGQNGGFVVSLGWFVVGQVLLIGLSWFYRMFMPKIASELGLQNAACGVALAGYLIAGGIALKTAVSGSFTTWSAELASVGIYMAVWFVTLFFVHLVANFITFWGHPLKREIMSDKNWGSAVLHAGISVAFTIVFTHWIG
ncbi:MAG: hypothetical protein A3A28_04635 [Candidatus Sungbacteria bacterium RIFCSPLOWO2_01_FULL_47_32]|uniref:DUF350 domain-containing protein n=1 Tax=Candidatus Sungbacteria bacterium RIFCSPHIGHO2_01_FULL_47_32 TaxID=1802264 RepID=A0A1G2K825_9BACT|nr:MAG: hypothetical protein A2633_06605 [Candidatus Sungbacteria bacterium RIFCSPHIGHO2_01_FULL_47_32]OHA06326.1 MAG: hypothetical protein A3A28_04635 [Candidatus Sungbacteria bacterium RIFCSPLOWO2_01_FULL_47_32]